MKPQEAIKKPVKIKYLIFEYTEEGVRELQDFVGKSLGVIKKARHINSKAEAEILTLEDGFDNRVKHIATEGDYIIQGVNGEFYPCKPEIFKKTYLLNNEELVTEETKTEIIEGLDEFGTYVLIDKGMEVFCESNNKREILEIYRKNKHHTKLYVRIDSI